MEAEKRGVAAESGGIWHLDGDRLTSLAESSAGNATVLIPTEQVLLVTVDLPLPSRRQRLNALPFAIEDHIAEPISEVHVALGMEVAPRRHLAAAVRHEVMEDWVRRVTDAGLIHCALVPDALSLPVPDEGSWSTQRLGDRVLVRTPDGGGFATSIGHFAVLWSAAGSPLCVDLGEALPEEIPTVRGEIALEPMTTRLMVPALDLRQGPYAKPRRSLPISTRKVAAVIAAGVLAHAAIAIVDTVALVNIADDRRAEAQVLVEKYLPGVVVTDDFAAEVNELLATGGGAPRSTFFPLLVRASAALGQAGSGTTLRELSYDAGAGELSLQVEQPDIGALRRAEAALARAGLNAASGAATVGADGAAARIVVRDAAATGAP
jgi:general secretion pathway protein L